MKQLSIDNHIKQISLSTLEMKEFIEYNKINKLFKLNLKKIIRSCNHREKQIIYCIQGKMFYAHR